MKIIFLVFTVILSINTYAQSSLQDQLNSLNNEQNRIIADENRKRAIAAQQEQERQRVIAAQQEAQAKAQKAAADARERERQKDKARNQTFEDENRQIDLELRRAALEKEKARAKRSNEYIDQELKREGAVTDVVQSQADATRNVSQGEKDLRSGIGKGAAKSGWFDKIFK
jgi:hypothetical protein